MKILTFQNEGVRKAVFSLKDKNILENTTEEKLLIRKKGTQYILKVKPKTKSNKTFKRIPLKNYSVSHVWFTQFPSKEDLFFFRYDSNGNKYLMKIFKNQWKYRFLLLNIISLTNFHLKEKI